MGYWSDAARSACQRAPYDAFKYGIGALCTAIVAGAICAKEVSLGMTPIGIWLWAGMGLCVLFLAGAFAWGFLRYQRRLVIHSAIWLHKDSTDVKAMLSSKIKGQNALDVFAKREVLGDPFPHAPKRLVIVYTVGDGTPQEAIFNEHERVVLP